MFYISLFTRYTIEQQKKRVIPDKSSLIMKIKPVPWKNCLDTNVESLVPKENGWGFGTKMVRGEQFAFWWGVQRTCSRVNAFGDLGRVWKWIRVFWRSRFRKRKRLWICNVRHIFKFGWRGRGIIIWFLHSIFFLCLSDHFNRIKWFRSYDTCVYTCVVYSN